VGGLVGPLVGDSVGISDGELDGNYACPSGKMVLKIQYFEVSIALSSPS